MSKTETPKEVYMITGEVDSRRQSAVDELVSQVKDGEIEQFDGFKATADEIIEAAATLPFLSERKVVIVDRVDRMDPEDQGKIAKFIPKLGPAMRMIFLTSEQVKAMKGKPKQEEEEEEEEQEEGEKKKPKKRKKGLQSDLTKAVKEHGTVRDFGKMRFSDLSARLRKGLQARGKKIEEQALQALTSSIAGSPSIAESELDKLTAYVGDQPSITLRDVDKVVTKSPEDRVFHLIDAIAMRRPHSAMRLLNETLAVSAKPDGEVPKILGMMGRHFRLLYQTKFLQTRGVRNLKAIPEELQSLLIQERKLNPAGVTDYQQGKFIEQANAFSLNEIELCMKHVLACELAVKGLGKTAASPRLSLEMLILRLSQRKRSVR